MVYSFIIFFLYCSFALKQRTKNSRPGNSAKILNKFFNASVSYDANLVNQLKFIISNLKQKKSRKNSAPDIYVLLW